MKTLVALLPLIALSACSLLPVPALQEQPSVEASAQAQAGTRVVTGYGRTSFERPPAGLSYTKIASGHFDDYALRSDGQLLTTSTASYCSLGVPTLPQGQRYLDVDTSNLNVIALRSDGQVVGWGSGECSPFVESQWPKDSRFRAVATGERFSLALRSDGTLAAWGDNTYGQLNVPALPSGLRYTAVDAVWNAGFALRSDGRIIVWGNSELRNVPALPAGVVYTAFSVYSMPGAASNPVHGVALRSDGQAVTWGSAALSVPPLPSGLRYTAVTSCYECIALIRSDNEIISRGQAYTGVSDIAFPSLPLGQRYLTVAGDSLDVLALIADLPVPRSHYAITLDGLPSGKVVSSVSLGRGVISGDGRSSNPNPIQVSGIVKGSSESRAVVVGATTNKSLARLGASRTSVSGGTLALSFVPSFNSQGVTVKSLKVTGGPCSPSFPGFPCLPIKLTVRLYALDGTSRTVPLTLGSSLTVNLGDAGVKAMQVSSSAPFAIDDIVFGE